MNPKLIAFLLLSSLPVAAQAPAQSATSTQKPATERAAAPKAGQRLNPDGTRVIPAIAAIEKRTPKLPPFKPQQPLRIQLANGMVIFLQEDHELPLIDGIARVRGGGRDVAAEKTGLINIYGDVWRTGGTKEKTGDDLDDYLEARAASVETGGALDSTTIGFSSLKQDFNDVFRIFVGLMRTPEFRQDKIDLAKQQAKTAISRRNEEASAIANREVRRLVYGKDNPYARQAEYWTVDAVTREDLVAFHKRFLYPNNMILGIVGDFDPKQMEALLRQTFESWPKGPAAERVKAEFRDPKPGINFIAKEDVNQSTIQMATLGITRDNPDFYAVTVLNEALGGGFSARLLKTIRTQMGLAYSVGGGVGANFDHPGMLRVVMGTKSEQTAKAIDALYDQLEQAVKTPFTPEEINLAKANILNSFVFNFDTKEKVLREKMAYEFYGYPLDTLEKYRTEVEKVTAADVNRVAKRYIDRNKLAVLVVGKAQDFDRPLSSYGKVEDIDITILNEPPAAAGTAPQPATQSNAEGKALIAKVVNFLGGKEKIGAVKAIWQKTDTERVTPMGSMTMQTTDTIVLPDRVRSEMTSQQGQMTAVISPTAAFIAVPGQTMDFPAAMKDEAIKGIKRELLWVAQHADNPAFAFAANGSEGGLAVLDVQTDGGATRWFVNAATGEVKRSAYKTLGQQGPVQREVEYADYRDAEGLNLPAKRVVKENGQVSQSVTVKELKLNPQVDPKSFEKPAP